MFHSPALNLLDSEKWGHYLTGRKPSAGEKGQEKSACVRRTKEARLQSESRVITHYPCFKSDHREYQDSETFPEGFDL